MMLRLILLALFLLLAVSAAAYVLWVEREAKRKRDMIEALNREIHDIAFEHADINPELSAAVLHRFEEASKYPAGFPVTDIPADVLQLCLAHRQTEPDLSWILADTIRSRGVTIGPKELS